VIKVEERRRRTTCAVAALVQGQSALFDPINRNKKSITLNLKSEAGSELLLSLVEKADVARRGKPAGSDGALASAGTCFTRAPSPRHVARSRVMGRTVVCIAGRPRSVHARGSALDSTARDRAAGRCLAPDGWRTSAAAACSRRSRSSRWSRCSGGETVAGPRCNRTVLPITRDRAHDEARVRA